MYLPPDILKREDLTAMDKLVYAVIRDHIAHRQIRTAFLGLESIANKVGGGTRTVTRSVATLEAADLLVVERKPGVRVTYQLPKHLKVKTKWLHGSEIMCNLEAIDKALDIIDVMSQRHPTRTSNGTITQAVGSIRSMLWRKTGRAYAIGRRRQADAESSAANARWLDAVHKAQRGGSGIGAVPPRAEPTEVL